MFIWFEAAVDSIQTQQSVARPAMDSLNATGFHYCPVEIVVKIFLNLESASSILAFRAVNRYLAEIFDASTELRYQVKLFSWGYESVDSIGHESSSPESINIGDRIKSLKHVVKNFGALDWKDMRFQTSKSFSDYVLSDGLMTFVMYPDSKELRVVEMPSRVRNRKHVVRTKVRLPFAVADMAVDPSQDLLVLSEQYVGINLLRFCIHHPSRTCRITGGDGSPRPPAMPWGTNGSSSPLKLHFKSLSQPLSNHPQALLPIFTTTVRSIAMIKTEAKGDLVAVLVSHGMSSGSLILLNWQTGAIVSFPPALSSPSHSQIPD